MQRSAIVLPSGTATDANRDTKPDVDDFDGLPSTKLRVALEAEPTTQTGLQAPRLSRPLPARTTASQWPRLPVPSVPQRPSLPTPLPTPLPTEDEPRTQLRHAATRPSLPPPELALTPAMTPILPPPFRDAGAQERTVILALPPIDPTPPPEVAIRTPFAMAVPPDESGPRAFVFAPPLEAEVLGQRLPLSRVALIVGATLLVAAIVVVVGLRPRHASLAAAASAEPVMTLPAAVPSVPPIAAAAEPPTPQPPAPAPPVVAAAHPPAKAPAHRGRRIPTRRGQ